MAFSNNQVLTAADLNNLASLTTAETFTATQSFNGAGNPKVNSSADFVEQSSTPATPSAGNARVFVDNANPPLLKIIQDDGDDAIVGGWQYDESRRIWKLADRDSDFLQQYGEITITNDFFCTFFDTTNLLVHTAQGTWKYLQTGTATFTDATSRGGAFQVSTAASTNDRAAFLTAHSTTRKSVFQIADQVQFMMILAVANSTATKIIQCGLAEDPTAASNPGTDGVYFQYDSSASANWRGIVRNASANTDSNLGVAASTSVIHLWFVIDSGVNVKFYTRNTITDAWTLQATNVGTQPSGDSLVPFFRVQTLTTSAAAMDVHKIHITGRYSI